MDHRSFLADCQATRDREHNANPFHKQGFQADYVRHLDAVQIALYLH